MAGASVDVEDESIARLALKDGQSRKAPITPP